MPNGNVTKKYINFQQQNVHNKGGGYTEGKGELSLSLNTMP
jgi:hypothetical protein